MLIFSSYTILYRIDNEYEKLSKRYNVAADKIKNVLAKKSVAQDIAVGKAIDLIKSSAKITEKKAEAKKKPAVSKKSDKKTDKKLKKN